MFTFCVWPVTLFLQLGRVFVAPKGQLGRASALCPLWKEPSWWLSGKMVISLEGRWWYQALMVRKYNIALWRGRMTLTCGNDGIYKGAFGRGAEIIVYHAYKFLGQKARISTFLVWPYEDQLHPFGCPQLWWFWRCGLEARTRYILFLKKFLKFLPHFRDFRNGLSMAFVWGLVALWSLRRVSL